MHESTNEGTWEGLIAQTEWMRRLARRLVLDPNTADDVVQEAFVAALVSPPDARRPARPWLARVLTHSAWKSFRSQGRRARREVAAALPEALPATDELVQRLDLQRRLATALRSLDEPYRTTLLLHFVEDIPSAEIARRQAIPDSTVRWRVRQGLDLLRRRMDDAHSGDRRAWMTVLLPLAREPAAQGLAATGLSVSLLAAGACVLILGAAWLLLDRGQDGGAAPPGARSRPDGVRAESAPASAASEEERTALVAEPPAGEASTLVTATVIARLVGEDGSPSAGVALCRIVEKRGDNEPDTQPAAYAGVRAESGADGRVVLAVPRTERDEELGDEGKWEATFATRSPLFAPREIQAVVSTDRVTHLGTLRLQPAGTVIGHVRDHRGEPVADVAVMARPNTDEYWSLANAVRHRNDSAASVTTVTTADGSFRLESVPAYLAILSVGSERRSVSVDPGGVAETHFELPQEDHSGQVRCEVVDPEGRPVPDVRLTFRSPRADGWRTNLDETDQNGVFYLAETPSGLLDREVWVEDKAGLYTQRLFRIGTALEALRRIRLEPADNIEIQVRDEEGNAVTRFDAQLNADRPAILDDAYDHRSDMGVWRVRRPAQPFTVSVCAIGFEKVRLGPFEPSATASPIVATLGHQPGLSGRVTFEGRPVAGARILLAEPAGEGERIECLGFASRRRPGALRDAVLSDEQGRFHVPLGRKGPYFVRAEAAGFAPGEAGPIDFEPGIGVAGAEIILCRGGTLRGRVLAPPDADPTGMIVGVSCGDGFPTSQRIGPDGAYEFTNLTPGPWQVAPCEHEVGPSPDSLVAATYYDQAAPKPLADWSCEVLAGEITTFDVDLRTFGGAILHGRIEVAGLPGVQAWTIAARHEDLLPSVDERWYGGAAADGTFLLRSVRSGRHDLHIDAGSGPLSQTTIRTVVNLSPGENVWNLSFETGFLAGRILTPKGAGPIYHLLLHDLDTVMLTYLRPGEDGTIPRRLVPAGPGRIVERRHDASPDSWPVLAEVEVPAGGEARVEIE
ncbi:MAG: sigma-70 family RNA polymerase sigma factor [Planctomycetes bacterium]|nr:sigma-70 family RNA polymerase sigma factor [Planctomycetota bacterium]